MSDELKSNATEPMAEAAPAEAAPPSEAEQLIEAIKARLHEARVRAVAHALGR